MRSVSLMLPSSMHGAAHTRLVEPPQIQEVVTDMNVLVAQQGDQIDALADNVDHAGYMTSVARQEVTKAKRLQDINRRYAVRPPVRIDVEWILCMNAVNDASRNEHF